MSRLKELIYEIHRRSLWQVLGIYLIGGWLVLQVADTMAGALNLPEWAPAFALFLLVICLPIVLATAFVQEGIGHRGPLGEAETTSGDTSVQSTGVDKASARRFLTWRNATTTGVVACALWGIVAAGWFLLVGRGDKPGGDAPVTSMESLESIAVLPFADLSPEGDQEYFSDGISEELLNLLGTIPRLQVAARTSSFSFKDQNLEIPEIAERLHVAHVLEGSVRKAGNQVRITAQLIRADDGFQMWAESWDRSLDDIFEIQREIASEVADQLSVTLLGTAPTIEETNPEAYALFLHARQLGRQRTEESLEQSNALYEQALEIDPDYAAAWAGLARNYTRQANVVLRPVDEGFRLAREATNRALAIDPESAEAWANLGFIAMNHDNDASVAARHYERALKLAPTDTDILRSTARLAVALGRLDEAITLLEYAAQRDPVNSVAHAGLCYAYFWEGRLDEAIASCRFALSLSPGRIAAQYIIGAALLLKGKPESALKAMQQESSEAFRLSGLAMAHHALGQKAASNAVLAELIDKHEQGWSYNIASVLAFRGETDLAFEWLARAVQYNDPGLSEIPVEITFANIQDDPRWLPFLESIGKSPEQLGAIEFNVPLPM